MRIAFLQEKAWIHRVFAAKHIQQLREYGEVILNESDVPLSLEQIKRQIEDADVVITSWGCGEMSEEILDCAPKLKVVLHAAGTVKGIATPELWARDIRISNASEPLGKGVAETALGMLISSLKDFWRLTDQTGKGGWREGGHVRELYEIRVGVVGAGKVGCHFIKLLQNFDLEVLVYDPLLSAENAQRMGASKVELEGLLSQADVISIHAPLLPETRHMFNKKRFALMKDDCVLINTARGGLIDETALLEELQKGRFFACLDVTDPEPPAPTHPFRTLPNVMLTPHIAGSVNNGLHRIAQFVVEDLKLFVEGKSMRGEVYQEQLSSLA